MSLSVIVKETMSGWLQLEGREKADFSFEIEATSKKLFSLTAPRPFTGTARYGIDKKPIPVRGELTILPTGPKYDFQMNINGLGDVRIAGKKQYKLRNLKASLTTCPLNVYKNGEIIGSALVSYKDPLWSFPFKALSLAS